MGRRCRNRRRVGVGRAHSAESGHPQRDDREHAGRGCCRPHDSESITESHRKPGISAIGTGLIGAEICRRPLVAWCSEESVNGFGATGSD